MMNPFYGRYDPRQNMFASEIVQSQSANKQISNNLYPKLYARYIPPKPEVTRDARETLTEPESKQASAAHDSVEEGSRNVDQLQPKDGQLKEKSKKRKRDGPGAPTTEYTKPLDTIHLSKEQNVAMRTSSLPYVPKKLTEGRKHTKLHNDARAVHEETKDEAYVQKHKSILSKFEKSSKVSEVLRQGHKDDVRPEPKQDELHG
jgi:hypothetical protein